MRHLICRLRKKERSKKGKTMTFYTLEEGGGLEFKKGGVPYVAGMLAQRAAERKTFDHRQEKKACRLFA